MSEAGAATLPSRAARLGRVLAATWRLALAEAAAYRAATLVWVLTTAFPLVSLALWYALAEGGAIGGYTRAGFVAYFVAAFVVRQLTACWIVWELSVEISDGTLSTRLMRPLHPLLHHAMANLAGLPGRVLLAAPLAAGVLVLADGAAFVAGPQLLLAGPALLLAWLINVAVQVCISSLAFWVTRATALYEVWLGCYAVLSGYAVPVDLLPGWLTAGARCLPFHAALGFPVELILGRLSVREVAAGLALQGLWLALFAGLARSLWRAGLRVYGGVGT